MKKLVLIWVSFLFAGSGALVVLPQYLASDRSKKLDQNIPLTTASEDTITAKKAHLLDAARLQEFEAFVRQACKQCDVPGAAVGIVQNGNIIFEKGFGFSDLNNHKKVLPQTLFMIGSITKPLTTFMMARLIDEGIFSWDTPVTELMPNFALGDDEITKKLSMKHMVSANTGIPRQDIQFFFNYDHASPESRMEEMRDMKPTAAFGEKFQYSNSMVMAAGYIAAQSVCKDADLGQAYDSVMQLHAFDPIGMSATTLDFSKVKKVDHAAPHVKNLKGEYKPYSSYDERWVKSLRPAGGVWSNIHDMAQYMIVELNNGINAKGQRVVSEENLLKRREPQIEMDTEGNYALALMIEDDCGVLSVGHSGGMMGFTSLLTFFPEHNVGFVVLTNVNDSYKLIKAIKRKFIELLFDEQSLAQEMVKEYIEQTNKMVKKNLENISFELDSRKIKPFLGTYTHPTLGQLIVQETEDGAEMDAGVWKSRLEQKTENDGTVKLVTDIPFAGFEFLPQEENGSMQLVLEAEQQKYVFNATIA